MTKKVIWLINQYASTPETGFGGRHYYLARELEKLGNQVYIVAASYTHLLRKPPAVCRAFTLERREGVSIVWIKLPRYSRAHSKKRILNWILFALKLSKLAGVIPDTPDVILYSSPSLVGFLGAEKLARKFGAHLIFEVRDIWPLTLCEIGGYSRAHPFIRFLQAIENRAYRNADVVISNLKYAHVHMVRHGMNINRFHWIPNGFSVAEAASPDPIPSNLQIRHSNNDFIVGYAGALGLANNMSELVQASILLRDHKNIVFAIVGSGDERKNLEDAITSAKTNNVRFFDSIPKAQVQSFLQECDVLFLSVKKSPLYNYGLALNKLYDYLYAGKPILYAAESGNYHPVTEANAGVELPPGDPAALAEVIMRLYRMSPQDRDTMGKNGRQAAISQYEYGMLASSLIDVL